MHGRRPAHPRRAEAAGVELADMDRVVEPAREGDEVARARERVDRDVREGEAAGGVPVADDVVPHAARAEAPHQLDRDRRLVVVDGPGVEPRLHAGLEECGRERRESLPPDKARSMGPPRAPIRRAVAVRPAVASSTSAGVTGPPPGVTSCICRRPSSARSGARVGVGTRTTRRAGACARPRAVWCPP